MTQFGERHRAALARGLEPDEELLAAARVIVTAAAANELPGDLSAAREEAVERRFLPYFQQRGERLRGRAARGRGSRHVRLAVARDVGFPLPGQIFVVGVSNRRLLVWATSRWLAAPAALSGSLPLREIAAIRVERRLGATRLGILLDAGPLLVAQPLWSRGLRAVADAFADVRSSA